MSRLLTDNQLRYNVPTPRTMSVKATKKLAARGRMQIQGLIDLHIFAINSGLQNYSPGLQVRFYYFEFR